jgi:hypothetical protein
MKVGRKNFAWEDSQRDGFLRQQQGREVLGVSNDDLLTETEAVLCGIVCAAGKDAV